MTAATRVGARGGLAEAVVDLDAIAANVRLLAARKPDAALMAVVKADGFGHGLLPAARAALAGGARWLGVTTVDEALALRAAGLTEPVLTWLYGPDADFAALLGAGVDVTAATTDHLTAIATAATTAATGRPAQVHLKIDTGMTRGGAAAADWPALVRHARDLEKAGAIAVRGIWTHLARADEPGHPGVADQLRRFAAAHDQATAAGLRPDVRHATNSAAILDVPEARLDLLRAGIAMYGPEPVPGKRFGLRPAMTLRTRVIDTAGPSHAVLPVGAAHGLPGAAAGRAHVLVGGRRCRVRRITLDHTVVDHAARAGTEVTVFGAAPTAADWAGWAGTNPHEILTGVGRFVPRRYEEAA